MTLDAAMSDGNLAANAAAFNDSPARRRERGIDVFGSGLGFIHGFNRFALKHLTA
ncbi:MAG: hypothetical protein ACRERV_12035 [Methylococcales bacterium]